MRNAGLSNRISVVAALLWCAAALAGCGYHFGASGTNLPAAAKTIYVEPFANRTQITSYNDQFMRYLKDEIASHKRLQLVDSPNDADLVLSGALIAAFDVTSAFNSVMEPTVYGENLAVSASLRDTHTNKVIWSSARISDTERYPVVSQSVVTTTPTFLQRNLRASDISRMTDIQVAATQERGARDQMMANLAKHMYDAMATGF